MMKPSNYSFITMMILGTIISLSANSWFAIWLGMEMNIIGFIPLMINKKNIFSSEAAMKYFIIQSISSSLLLLFTIQNNFFMQTQEMVNLALLTKLGAAPLHFWVPSLVESLTWINVGLLLTWQKLTPLFILCMNLNPSFIMWMTIMLSLIFGSLTGVYQTSTKKMLTYSSIAHLGWILSSTLLSLNITIIYFLMYTLSLLMTINQMKMSQINTLSKSTMLLKEKKMMLYTVMLNMGGMPPLLGFFPKLLTLFMLMKMKLILISLMLTMSAIINLFFYLRLAYSALSINNSTKKIKWQVNKIPTHSTMLMLMLGPMTLLLF